MPWGALAMTLLLASGASAQATPTSTPTPLPSIVFVFDAGGARVSGVRVRRAIASGLHRSLLRLTDDGASSATTTLTLAFEPPHHWVVDLARGDRHTTRRVELRSSTVRSLARLAIALVEETNPTPGVSPPVASRRGDWIALIGDEILDPFSSMPQARTRRRSLAVVDELVDPFAPGTGASRRYDDVIDPWSR